MVFCTEACGEAAKPPLPVMGDETPLTLVHANVKDYIGKTFIVVGGVEIGGTYSHGYENAQGTHVSLSFTEIRANRSRTGERLWYVYLRRDRAKPLVDAIVEAVTKGASGKLVRARLTFLPERCLTYVDGLWTTAELLDWQFLDADQKSWGPWTSVTVKPSKLEMKAALERRIEALQKELAVLKQQLADLQKEKP